LSCFVQGIEEKKDESTVYTRGLGAVPGPVMHSVFSSGLGAPSGMRGASYSVFSGGMGESGTGVASLSAPAIEQKSLYVFLLLIGGDGYILFDPLTSKHYRVVTKVVLPLGRFVRIKNLRRLPSLGKKGDTRYSLLQAIFLFHAIFILISFHS
jgi:hypothetical protein